MGIKPNIYIVITRTQLSQKLSAKRKSAPRSRTSPLFGNHTAQMATCIGSTPAVIFQTPVVTQHSLKRMFRSPASSSPGYTPSRVPKFDWSLGQISRVYCESLKREHGGLGAPLVWEWAELFCFLLQSVFDPWRLATARRGDR